MSSAQSGNSDFEELKGMALDHFWPHAQQVADLDKPEGLHVIKEGKGCWVTDLQGRRYLDELAGMWLVNIGHGRSEIADAVSEQMRHLKNIARETGTLIVVLWNMGEGYVREKFRARGATARLDRVDVALNYTEVSDTRRKLTIVKSRYGNLKESITVEFAGDFGFEAVEGVAARPSDTQVIGAYILRLVSEGPKSRQELLTALRPMGIKDNLVDKVLGDLCEKGKLRRTGRGMYALPGSSDPQ